MKAIVYKKYGTPDVLRPKEVEKPAPKENEVLVKIHAASVNSWDWDLVTGKPRIYRLLFGLFKPKHPIIGSDIAGRIEAVGKNVKQFQPGDVVFGDISGKGFGAFAEYVCAKEDLLALKPKSMSFEAAATIPQAGVLALQGLRQGKIKEGQKVLINGAGGGVGTFAVQMTKLWGADVTGVDSTAKLDMLREIGADHVIDFTKEDFTKNKQQYDMIVDVVANRPLAHYKRALKPNGICVIVGGIPARLISYALFGSWSLGSKKAGLLLHKPNQKDLNTLSELVEREKIKPIIDKIYPLDQTPEAVRYLGEGHAKGKVGITM